MTTERTEAVALLADLLTALPEPERSLLVEAAYKVYVDVYVAERNRPNPLSVIRGGAAL